MTWIGEDDSAAVDVVVNGRPATLRVPARRTLADALRDDGRTGTHLGCEHGVCGACTVLLDGRPVRSCLTLAVQAEGADVETVEGLADGPELHVLQRAFHEHGALQCGFCTPGFLMLALGLLRAEPGASPERVREVLTSNLCRCTGGAPIVRAVLAAQRELAGDVA
ncbi:(2Fe-2S)-binding protein [Jiangella alba]|uniref:Carbon-monoxide dehydrogenase small subunit n=1 Tax=Jiangella alba TaxID=561176 RepID=A0A1H5L2P4_9ACTN|nr:(2Fe-2S)-binding protein [Jiangella alba]SEE71233.1 carbon-monoxide dehydrogenase small subunit [Jiangella alba]